MTRLKPNAPCPCGSGKKSKKCCGGSVIGQVQDGYTREDRARAFARLDHFVDRFLEDEEELAYDELWELLPQGEDELSPDQRTQSNDLLDLWFAFDRPLEDGTFPVDRLLAQGEALSSGERLFLRTLRASSMRLWAVEDLAPGMTLTLRDVVEGDRVTVQERSASRTMARYEWIAARVVPLGASGQPELEAGVVHIPQLIRDSVLEQLRSKRERFLRAETPAERARFYKQLPPFFHAAWATSILQPPIPDLHNTDGEPLLITRLSFEVNAADGLPALLDRIPALEREREDAHRWLWQGSNRQGKPVVLGQLALTSAGLVLETNSSARGERGRALVEEHAGAAVRFRAASHEDLTGKVRDGLRSKHHHEHEHDAGPRPGAAEALPPEIIEVLTLDHLEQHYRGWLDEEIPALDRRTPRQAATTPELRPRLISLLEQLEGMYEAALKTRQPAYDPSWLWEELGIQDDARDQHPPPLAHERIALLLPGSGELLGQVADRLRRQPSFDDRTATVDEDWIRGDLDLQRFLRTPGTAPHSAEPSALAPYLRPLLNFELHRRKAFWVDEALSYTLDQTELAAAGAQLRLPFPAFALVFADRHFLSLAERLLSSRGEGPLAGQRLRVATVYVTETYAGTDRALELCFVFDALGADLPQRFEHRLALPELEPLQRALDAVAPRSMIEPSIEDRRPLPGLLRTTLNAILYATSAGVEPELRVPAKQVVRRPPGAASAPFSSEEVYFLPGAIEISQVRRLRRLERSSEGRELLHRFLVRGHWRRAAKDWADQRSRWIKPYWKGPDLAAIIERTYKLKP